MICFYSTFFDRVLIVKSVLSYSRKQPRFSCVGNWFHSAVSPTEKLSMVFQIWNKITHKCVLVDFTVWCKHRLHHELVTVLVIRIILKGLQAHWNHNENSIKNIIHSFKMSSNSWYYFHLGVVRRIVVIFPLLFPWKWSSQKVTICNDKLFNLLDGF